MIKPQTALVLIYNGVGYYPPTINAIDILADCFEKVIVIELKNYAAKSPSFKNNVVCHQIEYKVGARITRFSTFLNYLKLVRHTIKSENISLVLFYDVITALLSFGSNFFKTRKPLLWYHSHDTSAQYNINKMSFGYFAAKLENKMAERINFLTLPAAERRIYFHIPKFKGEYYVIPNYPSKKRYENVKAASPDPHCISLLYQGRISPGHGFEEIIGVLDRKVSGKTIELTLVGLISDQYKAELLSRAQSRFVTKHLQILPFIPYEELPSITAKHHIGLAIYTGKDQMNSTIATASNKVYEYMACGLPFLYYQNEHFDIHYRAMKWAIATDLSSDSLLSGISRIDNDYHSLSLSAKQDFLQNRNYEHVFGFVADRVVKKILYQTPDQADVLSNKV